MLKKLLQPPHFENLENISELFWRIGFDGDDRFDGYDEDLVDKLRHYLPRKEIFGTPSDDTFNLNMDDYIFRYDGDKGDDVVKIYSQYAVDISGEEGNDILSGSAQVVRIYGGPGNDIIKGSGSYLNVLHGGRGNDEITSLNAQFSYLDGGTGNDAIYGGAGNDEIIGGAGGDYLSGGQGDDEFNGGSGTDKFVFDKSNWGDDAIIDFEDGIDRILISQETGANSFSDLSISTQLSPTTSSGYQALVRFVDPSDPNIVNEITLYNIQASQLTEDDFYFG